MNHSIVEVLYRINVGREIDNELLGEAMTCLLMEKDSSRDVLFGALLTGLMGKSVESDEIATLLKCVFSLDNYDREKVPKHSTSKKVIEYIGSGKKGVKTINISTPSAIVAASAGACILKKGSSSTSSVTGSADFMSILGMKKMLDITQINNSLEKVNFAFVGIEDVIPNFDQFYSGKFYSPHILSFGLAALVTPLRGDVILYGLAHPDTNLCIKVLKQFNVSDAMVISSTYDGIHFIDEMGIYGNTKLVGMQNKVIGKTIDFNPIELLGVGMCSLTDISQCSNPLDNVKCALRILKGKGTEAQTNIIAMNAANLLYLAGVVNTISDGFEMARNEIMSLKALNKLEEFLEFTNSDMDQYRFVLKGC